MTQPDLFSQPQPEPQAVEPTQPAETSGPALDWQEQPERFCPVTGKPRPRFVWPTNYHKSGRKWYKQDGSTATERAEAKRQAQEAEDNRHLSARQLAAKIAEANGEAPTEPTPEDI